MRIEVTQEHIDKGNPGDCAICPVALAVLDAVEGAARADVGDDCIGFKRLKDDDWVFAKTPREVVDFFNAFDAHKPVKPISFEVEFKNSDEGVDE